MRTELCGTCRGKKKVLCRTCDGLGRTISVPSLLKSIIIKDTSSGRFENFSGNECPTCKGSGWVKCPQCGASGAIDISTFA